MRAAAFAALLLATSPAAADVGVLTPLIEGEERNEHWNVTLAEDGDALLRSLSGPGEVRFYFLRPAEGEEGQRRIGVTVDMRGAAEGGQAGLLYGYQENPKRYYLYTVGADGKITLMRRDEGGFRTMISSTKGGLQPEAVRLELVEDGQQVGFVVNGERGASLGNDTMGRGAVGIVAISPGTFRFEDFEVTLEGE